jgi:hypothetical protein
MKRELAAVALAVFGLAPAVGAACEYKDDSSASATPAVQVGLAPAPAASVVPNATIKKSVLPSAAKQAAVEVKAPVPDQKLAAGAIK